MANKPYAKVDIADYDGMQRYNGARSQHSNVSTQDGKRNYKPVILRVPSLLLLLVLTLLLIGMLQFALIRLPNIPGRFSSQNLKDAKNTLEDALDRRDDPFEYAAIYSASDRAQQAAAARSDMPSLETLWRLEVRQDTTTETPIPSEDTTTDTRTPASTANPSAYVPEEVTLTGTTAPSVYVPEDATPKPTGTTTPSVDVPVDPTITFPYAPQSDYVSKEITLTTAPSIYVPADGTITLSAAASSASSAYVPADATMTQSPASLRVYVTGRVTKTYTAASLSVYVTDGVTKTYTAASLSVYVTDGVTKTYTAASNGDPSSPAGPEPSAAPSGDYVPDEETKGAVVLKWTPMKVFLSTYLTVLLAVVYRILIAIVQTQLCLIDPFRQLSRSKGALASTALFTSYHSQALLGPFVALRNGRYALSAIGIACWISCLLPAFASEAVFVDTNWNCPDPKIGSPNVCPPRTTASVSVIRLLQGLLGFVAAVLFGLVFAIRRKTGLEEDPSSIAAVAKLMGHPSFRRDLSSVASGAGTTVSMMKQEIGRNRYRLDSWCSSSSEQHYGIIPAVTANNDAERDITRVAHQSTIVDWTGTSAMYHHVDPPSSAHKDDESPHRWRHNDYLLLLLAAGVFGVVLAYYLVGGDTGFNRFFNSSTFGPRFILTGSATIIANIWGCVQEDSMVMAPFTRLANGPASFDTLSFSPTITPILSTWRAMSNGYVFAGTVTIMTLLAEILSIAIAGVPFATGQLFLNFLVVAYMSLAILGIMILAAIAVIIHRRWEPRIPVIPDSLGPKMSYLVGTKMLENFGSNAGVGDENMLRSGRYEFRPLTGREGGHWWKVDQFVHQEEEYIY